MLVEELAGERRAAASCGQNENVSLGSGGVVWEIREVIAEAVERLRFLSQAAVYRARHGADLKGLGRERPYRCVLDGDGRQAEQNHSLPGTLHG